MAAYNQELHKLVCWLADWPKDILIKWFQDGFNNDVYNTCISWRALRTLCQRYMLAEEVEIDLATSHNCNAPGWHHFLPLNKKEPLRLPSQDLSPKHKIWVALDVEKRGTEQWNAELPKQLQNPVAVQGKRRENQQQVPMKRH